MRFVDRTDEPAPAVLTDPARKGQRELARARAAFAAGGDPATCPDFAAYKDDEVKLRLEALFHGKCAYCEFRYAAGAPMDVEHHRPKAQVAEDPALPGYWWLAMVWENLLPSCIDCNRQRSQVLVEASTSLEELAKQPRPVTTLAGKKDSFPLAAGGVRAAAEVAVFDDERALLLDPCRDKPEEHLAYAFDPGLPVGLAIPAGTEARKLRGAVSIQVYGLNRLQLVQERTRVLRQLEFLGDMVIELSQSIEALEQAPGPVAMHQAPAPEPHIGRVAARLRLLRDRTLAEMKQMTREDAPFTAMTRAWLEGFAGRLMAPTPSGDSA